MRRITLVCTILMVFSGCASVQPSSKKSNVAFLKDSASGITSTAIEKDLTRSADGKSEQILATSSYRIEMTLVTPSYLKITGEEEGKRLQKSDEEIKAALKQNLKAIEGKACFNIIIKTIQPIEGAQFKNWEGRLKTAKGENLPLDFFNFQGVDSVPKIRSGWDSQVFPWGNSTAACTKKSVNLVEGFSVVMTSKIHSEVPSSLMTWSF